MTDGPLWLALLTALGSGLFTMGSLTWWLSGQFSKVRGMVYDSAEKILAKLEYHEQHDDNRFNTVNNDLWAIKLRNASADDFSRRILSNVEELNRTELNRTKEIK